MIVKEAFWMKRGINMMRIKSKTRSKKEK